MVDGTHLDGDGQPTIDWGIPVEIPASVLTDLYHDGKLTRVTPVIVGNGAILYAPGTMNLGRTPRLANRDQHRALRALYPTCAIADCPTQFADSDIHHVTWWEPPHHGPTDHNNLLPLCSRHHHAVHDGGWHLTLSRDRTLTITYPDTTTHTTAPPERRSP